ncbi:Protein serine/threonine phosphatase PrpC [Mycoplasmopsis meleagridis]|uniref:Protein serine/threonine phosphatase PrpC,regulation of stationary phase n=1 Tax=Mycoplasmopsis meleagridis ATCC 25294 TaxID=1264554 RepID=A0A0F5H044_9BACT|nr:PP2C family serine/threonine-protein phosphatase [Mycoplasmopsis meleagridis]KKB26686.1 Protein serine/threonine phosphatase PrpC,regulation of stationary phase [Mycoplasmopsis meleagridis ATCC 25294]OAD18198.1 Protein serine/threonine phosphatase PrpC [Mycoplasmopsis meleagridis]VEU77741.1 Serine/threonine phosphatase stp [Mycoplasmopsis meleagridis]
MKIAKRTDIGIKRLENQDKVDIFQKEDFTLLILCDGMGGHFGGSLASTITINVFRDSFEKFLPLVHNLESFVNWFKETIAKVKNEMKIIANKDEAKLDMGTTLAACLVNEKENIMYVFNIGDSRIYVVNKYDDLKQITVDHNVLNRLINEENYRFEDAKLFPKWQALTSALGPNKRTKIEVFDLSKNLDQIKKIVATSDGVHAFIEHITFSNLLTLKIDLKDMCKRIIEEAILSHSTDNLSIGIIDLERN